MNRKSKDSKLFKQNNGDAKNSATNGKYSADDETGNAEETSRQERSESFARRALIQAGWAAPVVMSVVLPRHAQATHGPEGELCATHTDTRHSDVIHEDHNDTKLVIDDHTDRGTIHADTTSGTITHGDRSISHLDSIHEDIVHCDADTPIAFDPRRHDEDHNDVSGEGPTSEHVDIIGGQTT